jgi:hypothetical protein
MDSAPTNDAAPARATRRRARSLEEQLAMIAAGARLVPTFKPTRPTIDATLGGVSGGLLLEK